MAYDNDVPVAANQISADLLAMNANAALIAWAGLVGNLAFPATAVPSADANTLDDYQEGDHTATITCSTSGSYVLNGSKEVLAYTQIGRVVHLQGQLTVDSESSPSGDLQISIPITSGTLTDTADITVGVGIITAHGGSIPNSTYAYIAGLGQTFLKILTCPDNGVATAIDEGDVDTAWVLDINITYIAA